jgi:hypothetical protein
MYIGLRVNYLLILSDCNAAGTFSTDFRVIHKHQVALKCVQIEPSCFMRTKRGADGQTYRSQYSLFETMWKRLISVDYKITKICILVYL